MTMHFIHTRITHRIVASAFTLGLAFFAVPRVTASSPKSAPNVSVHTADGAAVRLADYKGKVVLIDFWASWCPPCKASFPALDAIYREFQERGLEVLAVNVDERRHDAETFLDAHPHGLTCLLYTSPSPRD